MTFATLGGSTDALLYGAGSDGGSAQTLTRTSAAPYVQNTAFLTPHYHSTDGYSALGVCEAFDDQTTTCKWSGAVELSQKRS